MKIVVALLSVVLLIFAVSGTPGEGRAADRVDALDPMASFIAVANTERPLNAYPERALADSTHGAAVPLASSNVSLKLSAAALDEVIVRYCQGCHNDRSMTGNLSLANFSVDSVGSIPVVPEKMVRKLRAEMMPPPGSRRPSPDTLLALVEALESRLDATAGRNPGTRTFQRLNRPEYERAIRDLLDLSINASEFLPLDTKSANFDNIADVQALSPTLLEAYLNAAASVSRLAIGDSAAPLLSARYTASPFASQHPWNQVEGAPYGTRGGIVSTHIFPADGEYTFRLNVEAGIGYRLEDIDVSIDGERIALLHYERGMERSIVSADAPLGADYVRSTPLKVKAGEHKVSVAFIRRSEGPYEDLIKPHDWSRASNGTASAGTTTPPHLMEMVILGPHSSEGVSETPSRKAIFSCMPTAPARERACATEIVNRLAAKAYRRPLEARDREGLMSFYDEAAKTGGFENGVRSALQAILASPHFVFRIEKTPDGVKPGEDFKLSDVDLASRLSFFLWGTIPDEELTTLAASGKLTSGRNLELQVQRMLNDPRAEALGSRFAAQWLRLQDLDKVRPDAFWFPDFDQQLADAMRRETELFFYDIVRNDRSVLDLFTANYTFVNERLALHYGIPGVAGMEFQRAEYPDSNRIGLLGQGSILVQTSLGNRTSPVLRGKWVMEVLLGNPPPPPPPGVPDLEETEGSVEGKFLTTRERMELHRKNPTCRSCHQYMDPMGLALDNFDVTGRWRYRENGVELDTRGNLYDGSPVSNPGELVNALIKRPIPLVRAFTENLLAYALGRRVEDFDQPLVRQINRDAEAKGYKMSSFIMGVVNSRAFQSKRAEGIAEGQQGMQH